MRVQQRSKRRFKHEETNFNRGIGGCDGGLLFGIAICVATNKISRKYDWHEEKNAKFVKFVYWHGKTIYWTFGTTAVTAGMVAICMLIPIIIVQTKADGIRAGNERRYDALFYKAQTEAIRDEFGIINKEYVDEVQAWNEHLAIYQSYSHNFWIGIFYPKRAYDGFKFIDLQSIRMKD